MKSEINKKSKFIKTIEPEDLQCIHYLVVL